LQSVLPRLFRHPEEGFLGAQTINIPARARPP
jgi:hypothetical protein